MKEEYGLACEHEHSLSILLARKDRFLKGDKWHTWIDYDKFQSLCRSGKTFGAEDYMVETPSWAIWGAEEKGFEPVVGPVAILGSHQKTGLGLEWDEAESGAEI